MHHSVRLLLLQGADLKASSVKELNVQLLPFDIPSVNTLVFMQPDGQ